MCNPLLYAEETEGTILLIALVSSTVTNEHSAKKDSQQ